VQDNQVTDSVLSGAINSLIAGEDMVEHVRHNILNTPMRRFERMYKYAASGAYTYGLPNARVMTSSDGADAVKAVIEAEIGQTITLEYAQFRPPNNVHLGWQDLTDNQGYIHETNEITALSTVKGFTVYLNKLVPVYRLAESQEADRTALGTFGKSSSSGPAWRRQAQATEEIAEIVTGQEWISGELEIESVQVHYVWKDAGTLAADGLSWVTPPAIHDEFYVLDLSSYAQDKEYHQAKYTYVSGLDTITGYWTYQPDEGLHPTLDSVFALNYTDPGTYFPFAIFRREGANRATPALAGTAEYLTTKKLLKYIGINFQEMADGIHENPGITDIEQAVIMMAVPANSQEPVEMEYLFKFFKNLEEATPASTATQMSTITSLSYGTDKSYAIEIADADFRVVLSFDVIRRRLIAGTIGAVGTYANTNVYTETVENHPFVRPTVTEDTRRYQKQVMPGIYEEIQVLNLRLRYDIYAGKGTVGFASDENLLIPLDYTITREMRLLDREKLYPRSLHFIANSMVIEKVKWYQQDWFKAVLIMAAIIYTFYTWDVKGGSWIAAVAIDVANGAYLVAALIAINAIASMLLLGYVINLAATELVEIIGVEATLILAAIAAAYGAYSGFQAGGIVKGSWAENALRAASGLVSGVQGVVQDMYLELQKDYEAFNTMTESRWEEVDRANDLLKFESLVDPLTFSGLRPLTVFGESPTNYFGRTIHSGNVGTLGFDIIENYVDLAVKLPSIQDTAWDSFYV
jgi:hypothetical protein